MKYHAQTQEFSVSKDDLDKASRSFLCAIKRIRTVAGLPLGKYEIDGLLNDVDHAQRCIIDGAMSMGIDLGAQWGNELDVSDAQ